MFVKKKASDIEAVNGDDTEGVGQADSRIRDSEVLEQMARAGPDEETRASVSPRLGDVHVMEIHTRPVVEARFEPPRVTAGPGGEGSTPTDQPPALQRDSILLVDGRL